MRVLLTGNLGYIGTVLTPRLLHAGHDVVGLDTDLYRRSHFDAGGTLVETPTIAKDLRAVEPGDLKGFDAVLHLAALSNDPLGNFRPEITDQINHRATVRLASLAKAAGVDRFVFSSSCSNYGAAGDTPLDERSAFNPVTPYGRSKVDAEIGLRDLADESFCPTCLRSATAYGASPRIRFDLVLNNLVAHAYTRGLVYMKSDGTPWRPIVHIEDIARAFVAVLEAPRDKVFDQAFNVGQTAENYRIREIAEIVVETVPGSHIEYADDAGPDKRCYRVNCDKIRQTLPAFAPQWDARRGAQQVYEACVEAKLRAEDFEGPRYQRIAHVQMLIDRELITPELEPLPGHAAENTVDVAGAARNGTPNGNGGKPTDRAAFERRCAQARCRVCHHAGLEPVLDLGMMPASDGLLTEERLAETEPRWPLEVGFCPACALLQLTHTVPPDQLFSTEYQYFSSFSEALLDHARTNVEELIERYGLGADSFVVELASNDGYLLKNFVQAGVPCLGIDPAPDPAEAARQVGVETLNAFFTPKLAAQLAQERRRADVIIASNVLAHVADTNGFVAGIAHLLDDDGVAVIEFPYVRDLVDHAEFDTIYHEHLCYFSATSVDRLLRRHGLFLNDVRRLPIHGGSLRLYVYPVEDVQPTVRRLLDEERELGVDRLAYYRDFGRRVDGLRQRIRGLVDGLVKQGKSIAAYGAAAKGTILLNAVGLDAGTIRWAADRNHHKHGRYMPGVRVPITAPRRILDEHPDYVLLLPWNFRDEILAQQKAYRSSGGRFIVPIPEPCVV